MASPAKGNRPRGGVRPSFLAGGLALMWFVQMQKGGVEADAPAWGLALTVGGRLFVDFVGACVIVSAVQLLFALARLGIAQWRARGQAELG